MTIKELRNEIKNIIIAQNGKIYGFNENNLKNAYGVSFTEIQNAINYFRFSKQQESFRKQYNFG